jgi:hypothetical protein
VIIPVDSMNASPDYSVVLTAYLIHVILDIFQNTFYLEAGNNPPSK